VGWKSVSISDLAASLIRFSYPEWCEPGTAFGLIYPEDALWSNGGWAAVPAKTPPGSWVSLTLRLCDRERYRRLGETWVRISRIQSGWVEFVWILAGILCLELSASVLVT
jgi:hypothetical protein